MDDFIGIALLLLFVTGLWRFVLRGLLSAGKSAVKVAQGKGSFKENMDLEWNGMGELQTRIVDFVAGEDGEGPKGLAIEIRGLIPVARQINLGFMTSILDFTDVDETSIVLSEVEVFQEEDTAAFLNLQNGGVIGPNQGFADWARVGVVFPELLVPAYGGERKLRMITRLVDVDKLPDIELGFGDPDQPGIITIVGNEYTLSYVGKGFMEASEHRDEARVLAIKLGMAIAIADGDLDDSEGNVIKDWVTKTIAPFGDAKRDALKSLYNDAMRNAYADAKAGDLALSQVTARLNEIAEEPQKYEAIELCFDVMAADGIADESEMDSIRRIAEALELDFKEMETLRDKKLIELDVGLDHQASLESIIGIQDDWSEDKIKVHIRTQFAKWNDRLNTLPEGQERDNAQRMLNMLSEARKKYA